MPEIFKVQLSISSSSPRQQVFIYNETRSLLWEGNAGSDIKKKIGGRLKAFFYGTIKDTLIVLGDEALWQDW